MYIKRILPFERYTKIDKTVITNSKISDGAMRLYCYLASVSLNTDLTDGYIKKVLNLSQSALTRRKRELKEADLILIEQFAPKIYNLYIGYSKIGASEVRHKIKAES